MTTYTFKGPNGRTVTLDGPPNATEAEKGAALRAYLAAHPEPDPSKPAESLGEKIVGGLKAAGRGINEFAQGADYPIVHTATGIANLLGVPRGATAALESHYPAPTTPAGLAGDVGGEAALYATGGAEARAGLKAAQLLPKVAKAAPEVLGAFGVGAAQQQGGPLARARAGADSALLAAAGSGLGAKLAKVGAHLASPAVDAVKRDLVALADKYGISLHVAQLLESRAGKALASGISKLPFSGSLSAEKRIAAAYNKAVARVVGIASGVVDKSTVRQALNRASDKYETLWGHSSSSVSDAQRQVLADVVEKVGQSGSLEARAQIPGLVKHVVAEADKNGGTLSGAQLKSILKNDLRPKLASKDSEVRGAALQVRAAIIGGMPESDQQALGAIDHHYRNLKTLQSVFKGREGVQGPLKPGALASHISSKYGLTPEMDELARLGVFIRPPSEGSPTAERYLLYHALGAAAGLGVTGAAGVEAARGNRLAAEGLSVLGSGILLGHALNSDSAGAAFRQFADSGLAQSTRAAIGKGVSAAAKAAPSVAPAAGVVASQP